MVWLVTSLDTGLPHRLGYLDPRTPQKEVHTCIKGKLKMVVTTVVVASRGGAVVEVVNSAAIVLLNHV